MMLIVLCVNDFPIGVYDDEKALQAAQDEHFKSFMPWEKDDVKKLRLHYHQHSFQLNAKAHL